ncbi:DUF805 domain-containing protein [Hymenobacter sp. BT730]|uniref:DUF805 domain-containing protein n=1 Tax=Hymenobacter sp. BT730 TaxID=3063332 RepID=UPI0026E026C7|nr:DUF805 domain-containing protein [Hymenobacter sp. BT730]
MEYFLLAFKKYAVFTGRARRKEYWMFVLFQILIGIAAIVLDSVLGTSIDSVGSGYLSLLASLIFIIPGLAVAVRRLHDVEKSGWFLLIGFIPVIGAIWLLVLFCTEGTRGENKYGPDPKSQEVLAY